MKRILIALALLMVVASCGNNTNAKSSESSAEAKAIETTTVEVLYFHGKQRCVTCMAIETQAATLVAELAYDNVVMKSVDFSSPEGEDIANKYMVASSSLIVVSGETAENLTVLGFRYARNNPEIFKEQLAETIQKMLK